MNNTVQTCGRLASKPQQRLVQFIFSKLSIWRKNYRTRRHLAELPEHLLDDIGYSEREVRKEIDKPFWRE